MRLMSWNVDKRLDELSEQIDKVKAIDPDVLMLQEIYVDLDEEESPWVSALQDLGYDEIEDTVELLLEKGRESGGANLTASKFDLKNSSSGRDLGFENKNGNENQKAKTIFSEKILRSTIELPEEVHVQGTSTDKKFETAELWNVRAVPGGGENYDGREKISIFEAVYEGLKNSPRNNSRKYQNRIKTPKLPAMLAGDFNSPRTEGPDGQVTTWAHKHKDHYYRWKSAEMNILKGLHEFGMVDVYRMLNGFGNPQVYSHENNGSRFRFDHIFASEVMSPENCYYDHSGLDCSDHAPIVAEFSL